MGFAETFSKECIERCPELHSCVSETALRQIVDSTVGIDTVIAEHQADGTLPEKCEKGPIACGASAIPSTAKMSEVAVATTVKIDAWGDSVSIRCRAQGTVGGGNIKPLN